MGPAQPDPLDPRVRLRWPELPRARTEVIPADSKAIPIVPKRLTHKSKRCRFVVDNAPKVSDLAEVGSDSTFPEVSRQTTAGASPRGDLRVAARDWAPDPVTR
jgi:hypothetical protein